MNKVCNRSKSWTSWATLSLTTACLSVQHCTMEVGRSSGAIVTDKTGKVCKPPTRAGNKYLFYPKKIRWNSDGKFFLSSSKAGPRVGFRAELNRAVQRLGQHSPAGWPHGRQLLTLPVPQGKDTVLPLTQEALGPLWHAQTRAGESEGLYLPR